MKKKMSWSPKCDKILDLLMKSMKETIIQDAEFYTKNLSMDIVEPQALEAALYKAVAVLNATNQVTILRKFGPEMGMNLIQIIETRAQVDVSKILLEDIKKSGEFSPEVQKIIDLIDKRINGEDPKEPELGEDLI